MENPLKAVGGALVALCFMAVAIGKNLDSCRGAKSAAKKALPDFVDVVPTEPSHFPDLNANAHIQEPPPDNTINFFNFPHVEPSDIPITAERDDAWPHVNASIVTGDEQILVKNPQTGEFRLYSNGNVEQGELDKLNTSRGKVLQLVNSPVITAQDAKHLIEKGVSFAVDQKYYQEIKQDKKPVQVIYVISRDDDKIRELLNISENQLDEAKRLFKPIYENKHIAEVESLASLEEELSKAKAKGFMPMVVFNNNENKIFGKSIALFDIPFITCNSYRFPNNGMLVSFNNLTIKYINESINNIFQADPHPTQINFITFLVENYNKFEETDKLKNHLILATMVTGGVGGVSLIIYSNNK